MREYEARFSPPCGSRNNSKLSPAHSSATTVFFRWNAPSHESRASMQNSGGGVRYDMRSNSKTSRFEHAGVILRLGRSRPQPDGMRRCCSLTRRHSLRDYMQGFQSKYWGWWYVAIGIGFLLLAIVSTMRGASLAGIVVRLIIAIGFELLGWMQFRSGS